MILARLLSPADYGLMAIVTVILGFFGLASDLGVNAAFVQSQDVSESERSSLYWLNVAIGLALTLVFMASSSTIAEIYGDERLQPLVALGALVFLIRALAHQVQMAAEKAMEFHRVVVAELASASIGLVVAIAAALAGAGVYALLAMTLCTALVSTFLLWVFVANGWRPQRHFSVAEVRPYLAFGAATVGTNIVNYANASMDVFLGGRRLPATALGAYAVPRSLVMELGVAVNSVVTRIGFPMIAKLQSDRNKVREVYLKTVNMTSATNAPLFVGIAFFAPEIVTVLLGAGWESSVEILRVLAVWGAIRSTANPVGSLLLGMGRADLSMKWNLVILLILPAAVLAGTSYGVLGLASALVGLQAALFVPAWYALIHRVCDAGLGEYSRAALAPFIIALCAVYPAVLVTSALQTPELRLLLAVTIAVPLYLALSWIANRAWVDAMLELLGR